MSYDIKLHVKAEGCDAYPMIAEPRISNPTYNIGTMLRKCMDWDFSQSEKDEEGKWHTCYYPCDFVIEKVENGLKELRKNRTYYKKFEPENGWGTVESAINALESLRLCIYEESEEIPLNCLYMSW